MAIANLEIQILGRGNTRSIVRSAAYRSGEKLFDEELHKSFDYTKKHEAVYSEIDLPPQAPPEFKDRATLWNSVAKVENYDKAQQARDFKIAIPNEWNLDTAKKAMREYVRDNFTNNGMIADWSIHWKNGNHHVHMLLTMREIDKNGHWQRKRKRIYKLDADGNKIPLIDPKTGQQAVERNGKNKNGTIKYKKLWVCEEQQNDWNSPEKCEEWRHSWEIHCNKYLDKSEQIDMRSYKRQGKDIKPQLKLGPAATALERKGIHTRKGNYNRKIKLDNAHRRTRTKLRAWKKLAADYEKRREEMRKDGLVELTEEEFLRQEAEEERQQQERRRQRQEAEQKRRQREAEQQRIQRQQAEQQRREEQKQQEAQPQQLNIADIEAAARAAWAEKAAAYEKMYSSPSHAFEPPKIAEKPHQTGMQQYSTAEKTAEKAKLEPIRAAQNSGHDKLYSQNIKTAQKRNMSVIDPLQRQNEAQKQQVQKQQRESDFENSQKISSKLRTSTQAEQQPGRWENGVYITADGRQLSAKPSGKTVQKKKKKKEQQQREKGKGRT